MKYIGIDIGKKGAISIMEDDKEIINYKMPLIGTALHYKGFYEIMEEHKDAKIVVYEKLGVIFGTSKKTAFSMGEQIGAIEMACIALKTPYIMVPAKEWQKEMFKGVSEIKKQGKKQRDTKAMALVAINRMFPDLKLTFGSVARVPHDGLVDAVLMAEFARRNY